MGLHKLRPNSVKPPDELLDSGFQDEAAAAAAADGEAGDAGGAVVPSVKRGDAVPTLRSVVTAGHPLLVSLT